MPSSSASWSSNVANLKLTEPMRTQAEISARLTNPGVIAVVRTQQPEQVLPLCAALVDGGLTALEITFTVPNACEVVAAVAKEFGARATVGVGTVLTAFQLKSALDAGAEFFVTPICRPELVPLAHTAGRPIMLGAYTPTEAQLAHEAGADFVNANKKGGPSRSRPRIKPARLSACPRPRCLRYAPPCSRRWI
ncbi:MAG: hypothetical protein EB034_04820 [Verrucomicrobia bacterium]|nr:hypothetical protein [Verrucomicrobiota bacterium]